MFAMLALRCSELVPFVPTTLLANGAELHSRRNPESATVASRESFNW